MTRNSLVRYIIREKFVNNLKNLLDKNQHKN